MIYMRTTHLISMRWLAFILCVTLLTSTAYAYGIRILNKDFEIVGGDLNVSGGGMICLGGECLLSWTTPPLQIVSNALGLSYLEQNGLGLSPGGALYVKAGTGLGYDASGNLYVLYGSTAGTAVEGNTTISINVGPGLSGGGTITLGAGGSVTVAHADTSSATTVSNTGGVVIQSLGIDTFGHVTEINSVDLDKRYVPLTRRIDTTAPLTGGGALSADLTLGMNIGTGLKVNAVTGALEMNITTDLSCPPGEALVLVNPATGKYACTTVDTNALDDVTGSGNAPYVPYWIDRNTLGSTNIYYDATNGRVGIGTASPGATLDVNGSLYASNGVYTSPSGYVTLYVSPDGTGDCTLGNPCSLDYALTHPLPTAVKIVLSPGTYVIQKNYLIRDRWVYFQGSGAAPEDVNIYFETYVAGTCNLSYSLEFDNSKVIMQNLTLSQAPKANASYGWCVSGGDGVPVVLGAGVFAGFSSLSLWSVIIVQRENWFISVKHTFADIGFNKLFELNALDQAQYLIITDFGYAVIHYWNSGFTFNVPSGYKIITGQGGWSFTGNFPSQYLPSYYIPTTLGIGTASPSEKLDVAGNVKASKFIDRDNTAYYVDPALASEVNVITAQTYHVGDAYTTLSKADHNALRVRTPYGYVDIGPKNASWSHFITDRPRFYFNKGITVDTGLIGSYDENLQLQTAGTTRVFIDASTGNVGIGTTSPTYKLDVSGTGRFIGTQRVLTLSDNGAGGTPRLYIEMTKAGSAAPGIELRNVDTSTTSTIGWIARDGTIVTFEYPFGTAQSKIDTSGRFYTRKVIDMDNTAYYVDPASTSELNALNVDQINGVPASSYARSCSTVTGTDPNALSCPTGKDMVSITFISGTGWVATCCVTS